MKQANSFASRKRLAFDFGAFDHSILLVLGPHFMQAFLEIDGVYNMEAGDVEI